MSDTRTTVYLSDKAKKALEELREKNPGGFNLSEFTSEKLLERRDELKEEYPEFFD